MLELLARVAVRRRWAVLAVTFVLALLAGFAGSGVIDRLTGGGFTADSAESSRAAELVDARFHDGPPNLVLVLSARDGGASVDDPAVTRQAVDLVRGLGGEPGLEQVRSYWTSGRTAALRSDDGRAGLVLARITGDEDDMKRASAVLGARYKQSAGPALDVRVGGIAEVYRQTGEAAQNDLRRAEMVALPAVLLALIVVFGGALAALLPLLIGALAILGTLAALNGLTHVADVSIFSLNLATALGLGLAIDYSLFIVTRYREGLRGGASPEQAAVRSVTTAGRTVVFSALTVATAMVGLLVFPMPILRSFAYAGIAVVALAAVGAVVVLPAMLVALGGRTEKFALRLPRRSTRTRRGGWEVLARFVTRRPALVTVGVIGILLVLGAPFLRIGFALNDDRNLPATAESRQVGDALRDRFAGREADAVIIASEKTVPDLAIGAYATRLSALPGVARVDSAVGSYRRGEFLNAYAATARDRAPEGTLLRVIPEVEAYSTEGRDLVAAVRSVDFATPVLVGGPSARLVDTIEIIKERLPLALGIIALAVGILVFVFTRSLFIPVKALITNMLSLTAVFGSMVWIFQEGHLRWLVGDFTVTGSLDVTMPVLMFCVAFGLSMDYELFVLSRIREEYLICGDNRRAVTAGIVGSGRIISIAALLMALVFAAFVTSSVTSIKLLGAGLAVAVIIDATIVRGLLVPAVMTLAGRANWWLPRFLRRRAGSADAAKQPQPV